MVCAPPRRAIKEYGAVIVNVHSRYILIAAAYIIGTRGRRGDGERKKTGNRGEKKARRDLVERKIEQIIQSRAARG